MKKWIAMLVPGAAWLAALPAPGALAPHAQVLRIEAGGGYLGASVKDVGVGEVAKLKLQQARGAFVESVRPDSPAAHAGLRTGDVVLAFDGETVRSAEQFARLVRETPAGRSVELRINRGGSPLTLSCELGRRGAGAFEDGDARSFEFSLPDLSELKEGHELPRFAWRDFGRSLRALELPGNGARLGLSYQLISGQLARYFQLEGDSGVLVTEVQPSSPAEQAGLRAGDVIASFDGRSVEDGSDFRRAVRAADAGRALVVEVVRDGRKLELKVTLPSAESQRPREPL